MYAGKGDQHEQRVYNLKAPRTTSIGNSGYQKLKHICIRQCCGQEVASNLVPFYTLEGTYIYNWAKHGERPPLW